MKGKIRTTLCAIGGVSILLTALLSALVFYNLFRSQVQEDLRATAGLLRYSYRADQGDWQLNGAVDGVRVTHIAPDGRVLLETDADADQMENHQERPEVLDALRLGQGQAVRHSDTLGRETLYHAVQLEDGSVLRVAREVNSVWAVFTGVLPGVGLVVVVVFLLCLLSSAKLTKRIVAPIVELGDHIEEAEESAPYDELVPFVRAVRQKNEDIRRQMKRLERHQEELRLITGNMDEGLILLGRDQLILSANPSAIRLLGAREADYAGKTLHYLSRDPQLEACVLAAEEGESKSLSTAVEGRDIQIYANPVLRQGKPTGAMCFLLDVTERSRSERMRRDFTANVSHELKTPLTTISGFAELLENGQVKAADVPGFGERIHREAVRLLSLITDIMKLSELDDLPRPRAAEPCGLLGIARESVESLEVCVARRDISIDFAGEDLTVQGDPVLLQQLVRNLCENAVRYNRDGGSVTVSVRGDADAVELAVTDTGIGIPTEHQSRVFERFYRVDKSRSKATGGTGLGLAIVKHIAEHHRAEVSLESEEGKGTTVRVRFPAAE